MKTEKCVIGAPYKAVEIAEYILARAYENGELVTNLKLQKLLYYAQAWYMVHHEGKRLFSDDIEAWKLGPVVRELYKKYKRYGNRSVDNEECGEESIRKLTLYERSFIDGFLAEFMEFTAISLVNMVHAETPWIEAFDENNPNAANVISVDSMYRFYSDMYEDEIQSEEDEEAYYTKIINEAKKGRIISSDKVREMLNVEN
jgi:uncharacterized phage-associated protein